MDIRPGTVIAGRYEVLETLGRGGMGMVYKAHDRDLDDTVALKVLRSDVAAEPDMARRFRSEIKLARRVRHRNVCGIHEYGEDGALRFIAMEYIEGVDFRHVLGTRGAPLAEEAYEVAIQTAQGLAAIHEAGIIHRDLKTPNIMRDARGHVRLMDFGIAKQAGEGTASMNATALGLIIGTPEYMSPEQARGEKLDFRSDIYSLGVVIFEIFTGDVPFRGETPIATIFKHFQDEPPIDGARMPEALKPVLRRALAKLPSARYSTAVEMGAALQAARERTFSSTRSAAAPGRATAPAATLPAATLPPGPLDGTVALAPSAVTHVPREGATRLERAPAEPPPPRRRMTARPPAAPAPLPPARPEAPASTVPVMAIAGGLAAAVILVGGAIAWIVHARSAARAPTGTITVVSPPASVAAPSPAAVPVGEPAVAPAVASGRGVLVVDAAPWGEVVEVVDAKGARQPVGASAYTPVALELPAGEYRVSLRHPGFGRPVTLSGRVEPSGVATRLRAEFQRETAEAYLRTTGW